jgi:hypothetical protein
MVEDIFEFWSPRRIDLRERVHPADKDILPSSKFDFLDRTALPGCYCGPLRTARVVLLFVGPGLKDSDDPDSPDYQQFHAEVRAGAKPLPNEQDQPEWWKWLRSKTKFIDKDWQSLRERVAILNFGAYHVAPGRSHNARSLAALPSTKITLDWATRVLFPQARNRDRVVVCLMARNAWGLEEGNCGSLFAPKTVRGVLVHGPARDEATNAIRDALGS